MENTTDSNSHPFADFTDADLDYENDTSPIVRHYTHDLMRGKDRIEITINPFLSEDIWKLLEYSIDDIDRTVQAADAASLWKFALIENFMVTSSAVKISYSRLEECDCAGKTVILKKLRRHLRAKYKDLAPSQVPSKIPSNSSKDSTQESQVVPLIARLPLTDDECTQLFAQCGAQVMRKTRTYRDVFTWRGLEWVPYDIQPGASHVALVQVLPKLKCWQVYGKPTCYAQAPFDFWILDKKAVYADTPLMVEVSHAWIATQMVIPDSEQYKIAKPSKKEAQLAAAIAEASGNPRAAQNGGSDISVTQAAARAAAKQAQQQQRRRRHAGGAL